MDERITKLSTALLTCRSHVNDVASPSCAGAAIYLYLDHSASKKDNRPPIDKIYFFS